MVGAVSSPHAVAWLGLVLSASLGELKDRVDVFLDSVGRDLRSYINLYKQAQDRSDGAEWLHRLAKEHQLTLPPSDSPPP